ncbi:MAG: hypothetical protein NZ703_01590, partial [Gemmataceae bacterium]|nr:hypothetical protein [Gemmataceae bacterium]
MGKHILDGYASAVRTEAGKPFTINGMHMWRRRLWTISKAALAVAIVVGVARQFVQLLGDGNWSGLAGLPHWQTVVGVGLLYLAAHTSWGSFWVLLLREQGIAIGWYAGLRCYFVSQFGKYLPGKAWVIFLRVGMLQPLGAPGVAVAVTATYETLASMGAGALVAVVCLPWLDLLPVAVAGRWGWFVVLAGLPVAIGLMHRVVQVWLRRRGADLSRLASAPGWLLLARGLLHGLTGWLLLACSLWLLLNELLGGAWSLSFSYYPALLGALALAYVAGFVVLVAPGGLGVR